MARSARSENFEWSEGASKTATLQDVAEAAGVTSMTVSRVIKGRDGVGEATRERVLRIAEQLNYTPNLSARALATGKTGVIAVISGGLNQFYYANIVHLLEEEITSSGYQMRLLHTHSDLKDLVSSTHSTAVDGVIIAGKYHLVEEFRALAPQVFQSCVFIDASKHSETDYVHSNLETAVESALEMMLQAGRTRLAYIGHFQSFQQKLSELISSRADEPAVVEERMQAYLSVVKRAGLTPELIGLQPAFILTSNSLSKYLQERGCPDGLLCVNDETAMYVYRAVLDAGYRVPDDVLLVGCDGLPFMECFEPPLSTIAQPMAEICALAWQFLQARIANRTLPRQHQSFEAQLVVRRSLQP